MVGAPGEWGVFVHEVNQGDNDVGEPHNELAIEVSETSECLDCLEVCQGWPYTDCIGLGYVHGDASGGDHETQEFNLMCVEQAHSGLECKSYLQRHFKTCQMWT